MPQSLARLHVHLIFSTKSREPILADDVRDSLHAYMATVLQNLGCAPVLINSVGDHAHLLFDLARTVAISKAVEDVKKASSKWIKTKGSRYPEFAWQAGYGAFAVSESNIEFVKRYIERQREHHRHKTFQEEYRGFLAKHGVAYDERYTCGVRPPLQGLVCIVGRVPRALRWAGVRRAVGALHDARHSSVAALIF